MASAPIRCTVATLAVGLCFGALRGAGAFTGVDTKRLVLTGFTTRERGPDGALKWHLKGRQAVLRGNDADIEGLDLTLHPEQGDERIRLTSPKCLFNRATKVCRSSSPIHVKGESLEVYGVGYDIMTQEQKVHIRSRARMIIRKAAGLLAAGVVEPSVDGDDGTDRRSGTGKEVP